jgi:hypothetical protein
LTIELIPRRKRSCCLLPDIPCIFPPVRLTGYDPRLRTLSKDTQLTSLTYPNLIGIRKLLSLVCNLPNAIRCQITERCGFKTARAMRRSRTCSPESWFRRSPLKGQSQMAHLEIHL